MTPIDFPNQPVIGLKLDAKLEKDDILALEKIVDKKLEKFSKLGVYVEMDQFQGISFEALIEDFKAFFPKISSFKKKAVVCPNSTLVNFGELVSKLIPFVEVKHFLPEETEAAKAWVIADLD